MLNVLISLVLTFSTLEPGEALTEEVTKPNTVLLASAAQEEPVEEIDDKAELYTITAYTAGPESTGKTSRDPAYGITASGTEVKEGRTCACPPSIPFGSKVYIAELDQTFVCEDRGSAITEGHIDIYMDNLEEALQFGVQSMKVSIQTR